jgi:hypothetical protein
MTQDLDFRFKGSLDPEIAVIFNKISYDFRSNFNEIVSTISRPFIADLDWWVEGPASRNTLASPLYHNLCCLLLVDYLIKNKMFCYSKVLVDNSALQIILIQLFKDFDISDCRLIYIRKKFTKKIKSKLALPFLIFQKSIQLLVSRLSGKINIKDIKSKPLILVDTFMLEEYTDNDRWYGEFWNNLSSDQKTNTYFIPTIVDTPIIKMHKVYKNLRNNSRNFLIKEDFLNFKNIFKTVGHFWNIRKMEIEPLIFLNCDISPLVKEELLTNTDKFSVIESLLNYDFVRNLRNQNIDVALSIDWFEGQVFDKSWSYAFHSFYPEVTIVGYRAFHSFSAYLCSFPIPIEYKAKCLPDQIAIQGEGSRKSLTEFFPKLDVRIIPSFKSTFVWDFNYKYNSKKNIVLITLPISIDMAIEMINKIHNVKVSLKVDDINNSFIIKPHPTHTLRLIKEMVRKVDSDIQVTEEKSFSALLNDTAVLLTDASSTCLEALACGIPVIIMSSSVGLSYNPLPDSVPSKIYCSAKTIDDIVYALKLFLNRNVSMSKELNVVGKKIRNDFFEPITQQGMNQFLNKNNK